MVSFFNRRVHVLCEELHGEQLKKHLKSGKDDHDFYCPGCWDKRKSIKAKPKKKLISGKATAPRLYGRTYGSKADQTFEDFSEVRALGRQRAHYVSDNEKKPDSEDLDSNSDEIDRSVKLKKRVQKAVNKQKTSLKDLTFVRSKEIHKTMHCVVDPYEMLRIILNLSKEDASDITKDLLLIRKI